MYRHRRRRRGKKKLDVNYVGYGNFQHFAIDDVEWQRKRLFDGRIYTHHQQYEYEPPKGALLDIFPITINSGVIFDGQGKTITINLSGSYTFSGLFRLKSTDSSTIKNITFNINSNILGVMNAGNGCIVSGTSYDSKNPQCNFEGCKVVLSGKLKSYCGAYVGAVDSNYTSSLSFTKCYVSMTEIGQDAGGFIAYSGPLHGDPVTPTVNTFTFSKCYAVDFGSFFHVLWSFEFVPINHQ